MLAPAGDWLDDGLPMASGLLLACVIGLCSHWSAGAAVFAAWLLLQGLTWGFTAWRGRDRVGADTDTCWEAGR